MKAATLTLAVVLPLLGTPGADTPGSPHAPAPPKPMDTSFLKLYAETRGFMLGRPQKPKVTPDGKAVLFLRAEAKTPKLKLFEFDVATGKTRELLSPESLLKGAEENLTPEEKARRERQRVTVGGFADYHLDPDGKRVLVKLSNSLYVLDRTTGKVSELKTGKDGAIVDPKWSPDGKLVGYVRGFDVYAYDLAADRELAVTTGGTQVKTHGLAEFVAQEEMGRFSGYWWSPDSKAIAYEEADHIGVEQWFVADPLKPDVPPAPQYYPRPGKKNVAVRLGVKQLAGGETVWVDWDHKEWEYLAAVKWDKTGPLTIQVQDRKQGQLALLNVTPANGTTVTLVTEKNAAWVPINQDVPAWLGAGTSFFWIEDSRRKPCLVYWDVHPKSATRGRVIGVAAGGASGFRSLITSHPENRVFAYTASDDPTELQIRYGIWDDDGPQDDEPDISLSVTPGVHSAEFSNDLSTYILSSTTLNSLPISKCYRQDRLGKKRDLIGTLPSVAIEPPFKPNVRVQKVGDYWTAVVRPRDFDPKKKYPVILDVYGGPKHLHVVRAMRNWLVPQWLADQGFVVVGVDNRGTPGRGSEWEKAIYQKFGTVPLDDQVKGLSALCDKFPELDRDRVGVVGWSFGGYMAANGVLRRPDVFKAAVAGAPVTDWEDYDTHYTERYMGLLPGSKKAYEEASLIPLAKGLKRPLLLVHGTADDNVYYRHTLKLSDVLFRAGRPFEALALPGVTHLYSADPVVMERLWAKTAGFFKAHLGKPR